MLSLWVYANGYLSHVRQLFQVSRVYILANNIYNLWYGLAV